MMRYSLSEPARTHRIAALFVRWTGTRAVLHRGYLLTSSLYFVTVAHLSASQLILLATVMSATLLLSDIPLGVLADTISRKWVLVAGHGFLAAGMVMTGLVTGFPLLLVTQVLWALGWSFSGGADIAWLNDELNQPDQVDRVLMARARSDLAGSAIGMIAFGLLGAVIGLGSAVVISGSGMALVGLFVATRFPEENFNPIRHKRWRASLSIFGRSVNLARRDHVILLVLIATLIINGASQVGWIIPKRLIDLGLPQNTELAYTAIIVASFVLGAVALRLVESRIDGIGVARRTYMLACLIGVLGTAALAAAPGVLVASLGVLLAQGIAFNVARAVSVIWVNRRVTPDVRATMHSFLSQAESLGEVLGGVTLAFIARTAGMSQTFATSTLLVALAGLLVLWWHPGRRSRPAEAGAA